MRGTFDVKARLRPTALVRAVRQAEEAAGSAVRIGCWRSATPAGSTSAIAGIQASDR